jgi:hypothetical protein
MLWRQRNSNATTESDYLGSQGKKKLTFITCTPQHWGVRTVSWVANGDDAACAFLSLKTHYHWNVQAPLDVHHVGMLRIWLGIVDDITAKRSIPTYGPHGW